MSSPTRKNPLYQVIADALEARILSAEYKPGEKIPPIREVADAFKCNKLTVQKAFDRLHQRGLIEKVIGSGSYVKYPEKIHAPGGFYDFKTDYPSESFFPYKEVQRLFNTLFENERDQALLPPPAGGDPELIRVLSHYYRVPAERMLIISGAQQGLDLVAKVFAAQMSESVLFEDPTYPGAITLFKARHFVRMDHDGPDIGQMERGLLPRIRLYYAMPAIHNPLGISYSEEKKKAVARLARSHPFYIIEDDYLGELRDNAGSRFIDLCPDRAIYIKSLSQTTVAGIRLGFMVAPRDVLDKFIYAKFSTDIASFGLLQKFVREFIKGGHYQDFLSMTRDKALRRKQRMAEAVGRFPFLEIPYSQTGYNLWVKSGIPMDIDPVPWRRGEEFSFSSRHRSCFRLSFMNLTDSAFEQGVVYLENLWRRFS